jgi:4-hydroxy-tetrahydrodipicolinate synthase
MMRMIAAIRPIRPDFSFLTGWEACLAPMLMVGCDGGTHASSNVVPEITRRIYDLCRAGEYQEAMQWNYRLLALFDAMLYPFEFPDGFRAAAALRGFDFGAGRLPRTGAQKAEREEMAKVLQGIVADLDLVAPPHALGD